MFYIIYYIVFLILCMFNKKYIINFYLKFNSYTQTFRIV